MKVELKEIVDQLSKAISLIDGFKVSAKVDDNERVVGWCIVELFEDGTIVPVPGLDFDTIEDMLYAYLS